jgi:hypothetical protein
MARFRRAATRLTATLRRAARSAWWDRQFESALLHRRVGCEPEPEPFRHTSPKSRALPAKLADGVSSSYAVLWDAFKRRAAGYSADEKAKLFSGTAKRVYRIA